MSSQAIALLFFGVVVAFTFGITYWASKKNVDASHHYVAGGKIKSWQNGFAITGDYLSASAFLGISGLIALQGFSGFYVATAGLLAFLTVLLLVAEPMRNLGKYTMADTLTRRFNIKGVRSAAALNTVVVSMFYMIAQLVGAGAILQLLLGIPFSLSVIVVGALMAIYVSVGGMIGTTWIQIFQAMLFMAGGLALAIAVLANFSFNPIAIFNAVESSAGFQAITPAAPSGLAAGLDGISFNLALIFGAAGLPHILIRFLTVSDAKTARRSVVFAAWFIGGFYALLPIIAYGAVIFIGQNTIAEQSAGGNLVLPQLAEALGGPIFLGFISAAAFGAILSTVSGLVIASSGAFAHDFYTNVMRNGEASERQQHRVARYTALAISVVAILIALPAQNFNVSVLVVLAFAVGASANFPVILLTIFWKNFNTVGAISGMLGGLIGCVGLILVGPNVMGEAAIFPLGNPAIVSIPLGFLTGFLGTLVGGKAAEKEREEGFQTDYEEIYVQANIGASYIGRRPEEASHATSYRSEEGGSTSGV